MYEPRTYRHRTNSSDLVSFEVIVKETDLHISATKDLKSEAFRAVNQCRESLETYIEEDPRFLDGLVPHTIKDNAPHIVREMARAAAFVGVGPMAAVAGAIAESVGRDLLAYSPEIIIENGGDIFIRSRKTRNIGIYAGESPFTGTLALEIQPEDTPLGICTSSGTVGHSLSFGEADAVIALSASTALADAAATAIGNRIKAAADIAQEVNNAESIAGLAGVVIIKDDKLGLWGNVRLVSLE
jgi:ApbE superfamily uncharacterized protein (UPF0280 family)